VLKIQEYLRSGKTLDDLNQEYGIVATHHEILPLVILNYSQIDSPKWPQLVRECRGLVLNKENYNLIARSFSRFFNMGEMQGEELDFHWNHCVTQEKHDGSLCLLYYFDSEWRANTRGSFGMGPMLNEWQAKYFGMPQNFTWQQGFCRALSIDKISDLNLDRSCTYVCEFCSPWNKVVRSYTTPRMYLLTRFVGEQEVGADDNPQFCKVEEYPLNNVKDITNFCNSHEEATFEGVVIKDDGFRRWKLKNSRYIALHHMKGNGDNLWNPKYLLPFILANEQGELLSYFPEAETVYRECEDKVNSAYAELEKVWAASKDIENQKEFALSIVGKTPFTGVLFTARKMKVNLKEQWQKHGDGILKTLFK
jgi:hypothetical protein